jgi:glucokinase
MVPTVMCIQALRRFVVITGLPGSGKSTLARQLGPVLNLPIIDKDIILERLFDSKGVGDAIWRRKLSRESDGILQAEATASNGAILVSFWRRPGMDKESGTPTSWLPQLSESLVNLHCFCPPELAAKRFITRRRHLGHLDIKRSFAETLSSLRANQAYPLPKIGKRINVDTTMECKIDVVVSRISAAFVLHAS